MVMPAPPTRTVAINRNDQTQVLRAPSRHRTGPVIGDNATQLAETAGRRRRRGFWLFAAILLICGLAAGAGWWFGIGPGAQVSVPSVAGKSPSAATAVLIAADLTVKATPKVVSDPDIAQDLVVGTDPPSGKRVAHAAPVTLLVSSGPALLSIPTLVGLDESAAGSAIETGIMFPGV